jgi:integrase/recombinase XerC
MDTKQAFADYLLKEKNYSLLTLRAYTDDVAAFESFIKKDDYEATLEEVNYSQVRSWIVSLVESGISNTSVNRKMSSLKSFYKFLLKSRQITINPLQKHKSLKTEKKVQVPFSENELQDVFLNNEYPEDFDGIRKPAYYRTFLHNRYAPCRTY